MLSFKYSANNVITYKVLCKVVDLLLKIQKMQVSAERGEEVGRNNG
jgi:hypothetical protein